MIETKPLKVNVSFSITFDYQYYYTEEEITDSNPELLRRIYEAKAIEGAIDISCDNLLTTKIIDELVPWIDNLCFRYIPNLSVGKQERMLYFSRAGFLDLQPMGNEIKLSGNKNQEAIYPMKELLQALFDCGKRFLKVMGGIKQGDPDYMANLNYISKSEKAARKALKN
jgi:hypothetical protein